MPMKSQTPEKIIAILTRTSLWVHASAIAARVGIQPWSANKALGKLYDAGKVERQQARGESTTTEGSYEWRLKR